MPKGKTIECAMESPTYRQILKEVAQGYRFVACNKTSKIIRVKKWKRYYTSQQPGVVLVKC